MIPPALRNKLLALVIAGVSAIGIAKVTTSTFEGTLYTPYRDPGNGTLTVCQGITGPSVIPGKTYTPGECATLQNRELLKADAVIDRYVKVPLSVTERAALIDFIYNAGSGNFARSTLLRKLNAGDHAGACNEYRKWIYAGGKRLKGLENRREVSTWLCRLPEQSR